VTVEKGVAGEGVEGGMDAGIGVVEDSRVVQVGVHWIRWQMIHWLRVIQAPIEEIHSWLQQERQRRQKQEFLFVCDNPQNGGDKDGFQELGCGAVKTGE